jgi:tRNA(fMet)-specific endonuclease VapC
MTHLLDTNACINYMRSSGQGPIATRLRQMDSSDVAVCAVTRAELYTGAHRSQQNVKNLADVRRFLSGFTLPAFDERIAETAGSIRAELEKRGTPIGPYDYLIAATAVGYGLVLVTHNVREFSRVPNLTYEDWQQTP